MSETKVAYKSCEKCQGQEIKFCSICDEEVDSKNRCPECRKFVKTTGCWDCHGCGYEEEYRVGDGTFFAVSYHSIEEHKEHVGFKGISFKTYKAKVVEIITEQTVKIRVKGKDIIVHTDDL